MYLHSNIFHNFFNNHIIFILNKTKSLENTSNPIPNSPLNKLLNSASAQFPSALTIKILQPNNNLLNSSFK